MKFIILMALVLLASCGSKSKLDAPTCDNAHDFVYGNQEKGEPAIPESVIGKCRCTDEDTYTCSTATRKVVCSARRGSDPGCHAIADWTPPPAPAPAPETPKKK